MLLLNILAVFTSTMVFHSAGEKEIDLQNIFYQYKQMNYFKVINPILASSVSLSGVTLLRFLDDNEDNAFKSNAYEQGLLKALSVYWIVT